MSKDFRLRKEDTVTYKTIMGNEAIYIIGNFYDNKPISFFEKDGSKVLKVERPIGYKVVWEKKEILDEKEKEYLSAVIKPFKSRAAYIKKRPFYREEEWIDIRVVNENIALPTFEKDTMYKGMELNKEYTLEELGL